MCLSFILYFYLYCIFIFYIFKNLVYQYWLHICEINYIMYNNAEMGDCLATVVMGRKVGCCCAPVAWLRPTSVPSGILIHPPIWPQYTWAEQWGAAVPLFFGGELGPHLTQCGQGQGLPTYQGLKVLSSSTPAYLNNLMQSAVPVWPLRSSDAPMLFAARTRTEFPRRAFSVAAPHTWNSLPFDIRSCHTLHTFKNAS